MLHYGRRKAIALDSFFYIVGPLLMAFASNASMLLAGRVLVGIGIGVSAVVAPTYLGEIAPAHMRGRIVESYEVLLCFGMLASVAMDVAFGHLPHNWRWMVGRMLLLECSVAWSMCTFNISPPVAVHSLTPHGCDFPGWIAKHFGAGLVRSVRALMTGMYFVIPVSHPARMSERASACGTAGLLVLPESPRWLVVSGRLDEALAVIHKIYTSAGLQNGEAL